MKRKHYAFAGRRADYWGPDHADCGREQNKLLAFPIGSGPGQMRALLFILAGLFGIDVRGKSTL